MQEAFLAHAAVALRRAEDSAAEDPSERVAAGQTLAEVRDVVVPEALRLDVLQVPPFAANSAKTLRAATGLEVAALLEDPIPARVVAPA